MDISQFPLLLASVTKNDSVKTPGRFQNLFKQDIADLTIALQNDAITNVTFKSTKEDLNRFFDKAYEDTISKNYFWGKAGQWDKDAEDIRDAITYAPQCHTVIGYLKKVQKLNQNAPIVQETIALLKEMLPLAEAINSLKTKIVKRQPKPVEDIRQKYNAPAASDSAMKQIFDVLKKVTDDAYEGLVARFNTRYLNIVAKFVERVQDAEVNGKVFSYYEYNALRTSNFDPEKYDVLKDLVEKNGEISHLTKKVTPMKLYSNWQQRVMGKAVARAKEIQEQFVVKNLKKLDSIVEGKGNFTKVVLDDTTLNMSTLEGVLTITFSDNSQFTCINSIVWSQSVHGKQFLRFPLNFTSVIMPDGSRMKQPSEERMNTVFLGK